MAESEDIQELFGHAFQLPSAKRRGFVLRSNYAPHIQQAALELLEHHVEESGFLQRPAMQTFSALVDRVPAQIAEFRLVREIGRGGMGVVYLAQDSVLDRTVALKLLGNHLTGSPTAVARFRREAKVAACLNHPAIVPIYRCGEDANVQFIAMEYVEGETLGGRLRNLRESAPEVPTEDSGPHGKRRRERHTIHPKTATTEYVRECTRLTSLVAEGLDFAHHAGVLHCDVKPSNILIDRDGYPRITDFGIARLEASERLTKSGDVLGSVQYMSPEQITSRNLDRRSDVFSLGVVLYEMLTFAPPFSGDSIPAVAESLKNTEPRSVRLFNPAVSKDLETVCHKALEKKPADRYPTAAHFAADLQCCLRGETIMAHPPSVARRASRWFGRHRTRSLTALVVLLLGSLAVAGGVQLHNHLGAMAAVSIDVDPPAAGAQVFIRRWNSALQTHDASELVGTVPVIDHYLDPGSCRFVIVAAGDQFAEFDAVLVAGSPLTSTVSIPDTATVTEGMVPFPAGAYTLRPYQWNTETQDAEFHLEGFFLDAHEVSNAQYRAFVDQTGYASPEQWNRFGYDPALAQRPVVGVTLADAAAYASWSGKRLPTAAEWQAAARSPDGRLYPWDPNLPPPVTVLPSYEALLGAQTADYATWYAEYATRTVDVASDPSPHSATGLCHSLGNVMELTSTVMDHDVNYLLVNGGSWIHHPQFADLRMTHVSPRDTCTLNVGFRCARSMSPSADLRK